MNNLGKADDDQECLRSARTRIRKGFDVDSNPFLPIKELGCCPSINNDALLTDNDKVEPG